MMWLMSGEHWVVVTFGGSDEQMPVGWMDQLLPTEMAAIEALESADVGTIDGNEIGDGTYELYFVGDDREEVWEVLAPIFEDAPIPWSRVELRLELEDPDPIVLLPGA